MARAALRNAAERSVEVDRQSLLETLIRNKEKHIKEFQEAMAAYKATLAERVEKAYLDAQVKLKKKFERFNEDLASLTDEEIQRQSDIFVFLNSIAVEMPVPRSYEEAYDTAIDVALWDTNNTLKLSGAEFQCFVRDQWEWTDTFKSVSAMYNK